MFMFDSIHGQIKVDYQTKKIIDTPEYQRLRNIKQLGGIYQVWTGASHNRFEHSLGVMYLARKYMDILNKSGNYFSTKEYELISIGALIHDIGHGVMSHLFDQWIGFSTHEERSIEIFIYMNNKYDLGYDYSDIYFIKNVISPDYSDIAFVDDKKYLYQIVSSANGIDVDRFDYILRDCHYTGMKYSFEIDQIMNNTFVKNNELVYSDKATCSIDSFFHTRYSMYKQVCNHPTVISVEHHIKDILSEIDSVFKISESVKNKDWDSFCKINDNILSVIEFMDNPKLEKALQITSDIKSRNILKLVGEVVSDKEIHIESTSENVIIIKSTIKYHSDELPKYVSDKRIKMNVPCKKYPEEHITKVMCLDKDDPYALSLLKFD